jgi:hypothetical protein
MKKITVFAALILLSATSCKNTWDQDDKDMFYKSCMDEANKWAGDKAKPYCDCMLEKIIKKYPNENDALDHMDSVMNDADLKSCKDEVMK